MISGQNNPNSILYYKGDNTAEYRFINALNALLEKDNSINILGSIAYYLYNIHIDGHEEYSDGSKRILRAEDLNIQICI